MEERERSSTLQFHISDMNSVVNSPSTIVPIANNVPMDMDSDSEAEQVALELTQAQEWLRIANEAWERCREERKRKEEERKAKIMVALKLAAEQAAELAVDQEQRIQLQESVQVSSAFNLEVDFIFSRTWKRWL